MKVLVWNMAGVGVALSPMLFVYPNAGVEKIEKLLTHCSVSNHLRKTLKVVF